MSETHYLISDASKKVDVESHVLRYWEEELELVVGVYVGDEVLRVDEGVIEREVWWVFAVPTGIGAGMDMACSTL